jgi:Uma2 family endonuclease
MFVTTLIEPEQIHRIRRDEFMRMIEAGAFPDDRRIQLLDGVLVTMSPQHDPHAEAIIRLNHLFMRALGDRAFVAVQLPFNASDYSRPEPDVALWRGPKVPEQVSLAVEVSDSTLRLDRLVKLRIYAQAGVPESWIVNLTDDLVERHTDPGPEVYQQVEMLRRGATIRLVEHPDVEVAVDAILPPRAD